jgi:hypothetical protein
MTPEDFNRSDDEALSAAARSLHEEWDSPNLWPGIAARLRDEDRASTIRRPWYATPAGMWRLAAAAAVLITLSSATWIMWPRIEPTTPAPDVAAAINERLLTDEKVAEIERAEGQYVRAIDELTKLAKPKLEKADSPLIVNLRERLMTIDAAIDECRMEIDRNRFNAHLREQLLWIYQEKRRTLEQVQESNGHAS